jgi:hypothetical protein
MPQPYSPVYFPSDWSAVSMGANNAVVDVPVDNATREVTVSPCLDPSTLTNTSAVLANNNLFFRSHNASAWHGVRTNIGISGTDKVYWEVVCTEDDNDTFVAGVGSAAAVLSNSPNTAGSLSYIQPNSGSGEKYDGTAIGAEFGDGDGTPGTSNENPVGTVWGFAVDYANQDLYMSKNGDWWNGDDFNSNTSGPGTIWDATLSNSVTLFPIIQGHNQGESITMRFASNSWQYAAPATYTALTNTMTGVGNHALWNPLDVHKDYVPTFSNGNLTATGNGGSVYSECRGTIGVSSGKFVIQITPGSTLTNGALLGVCRVSDMRAASAITSATGTKGVLCRSDNGGQIYSEGSAVQSSLGTWDSGNDMRVEVNADDGTVAFFKDGSAYGSAVSSITFDEPWTFIWMPFTGYAATLEHSIAAMDGTVTSGFKEWNTVNLPAPTVKNSDDGFALITLEDGDTIEASLANARTGWGSYIDVFFRETDGQDKEIRFSDDSGNSMHFNTNAAAGSEQTLSSGVNYSAFSWRVGATYGCYTAEISHTNGATTNQAHGLGSGAKTAVAKRSSGTGDWYVSHPNLSSANVRYNVQEATTSELVTVDGTNVTLNSSFASGTYRVIVWEQIEGFSAFIGYPHNGSTSDGPYLHFGGSASLVLWRNIDSSNSNDFFSTFPTYSSNGNGNPTDVRYNWGNQEKGYTGITIGDVTANGYKMRPSSGGAFGIGADDPMLVWAWGLRPVGGSGVAQARAR